MQMTRCLVIFLFIGLSAKADTTKESLGFVFFGDSGQGNTEQREVASGVEKFCKSNQCDFVALLGDNIYDEGVSSVRDPQWKTKFETPYQKLNLIFWAVLGNHDYLGNIQAEIDYTNHSKIWKMPSRYYEYTKADTTFFALDTEKFDKDQQKWLDNALSQSQSKWKIVYGHHPIYSYGMHGNTSSLVKSLLPLLKNRVDFYLSGHDHDKEYISLGYKPDFIISGASAETRPVGEGQYTLYSSDSLGFAHMQIDSGKASLKILDKNGAVEFKKEILKSRQADRVARN